MENAPAIVADFTAIAVSLLAHERDEEGRYPLRPAYALPLTEYVRRAAISGAQDREIFTVVTNSDGDVGRRSALLGMLGSGAREQVVDPGPSVVAARLNVSMELLQDEEDPDDPCAGAIVRWYRRLPAGEVPSVVRPRGGLTPGIPWRKAVPVKALIGAPIAGPRPLSQLGTPRVF